MVKLTKKDKVSNAQLKVAQLTDPHEQMFKVILSYQIENKFKFSSISSDGRKMSKNKRNTMQLEMFRSLGGFIDKSTKLSISDAEKKYMRKSDKRDGTYDPETKQPVEVIHFCLYEEGQAPNKHSDGVRLHGYFRANGYFVVTRMDWYHGVHKA
jgi:hypothetical protein